jgi:hypothetical protein
LPAYPDSIGLGERLVGHKTDVAGMVEGKIHIFRIKANHTRTGGIGKAYQRLNRRR